MAGEMLVLTNPKKRRKTASKQRRTRTKRARPARATVTLSATKKPRRRRRTIRINPRRRARRNPSVRGIVGQLTSSIMPAVQGAVGSIAVNAIYNRVPLPAMLKSGIMGTVTKAAMAVGLGMLASRFGGGQLGKNMASGALTVIALDQIRPMLPAGLSDVGYYGAGYSLNDVPNSLTDMPNSLSEYISDYSAYDVPSYDNVGEYISG